MSAMTIQKCTECGWLVADLGQTLCLSCWKKEREARMPLTVVYRIGGTERCEWRRTTGQTSMTEAMDRKADLEQMGYKALIFKTAVLNTVGMPEGWDWKQSA